MNIKTKQSASNHALEKHSVQTNGKFIIVINFINDVCICEYMTINAFVNN